MPLGRPVVEVATESVEGGRDVFVVTLEVLVPVIAGGVVVAIVDVARADGVDDDVAGVDDAASASARANWNFKGITAKAVTARTLTMKMAM